MESRNPNADQVCGGCPFDLPSGHKVKDHPTLGTVPPELLQPDGAPSEPTLVTQHTLTPEQWDSFGIPRGATVDMIFHFEVRVPGRPNQMLGPYRGVITRKEEG